MSIVVCTVVLGNDYHRFYTEMLLNSSRKGRALKSPTYYNHDVICLPQSHSRGYCKSIPIPCKTAHTRLAEMGLQGKITSHVSGAVAGVGGN